MGLEFILLSSSLMLVDAFPLMRTVPQNSYLARRSAAVEGTTLSTENDNDPTTAMGEVELPVSSPAPPVLDDGLNLSSKEISQMSFRELQRLVRLYHPQNDHVHAMTTSRLREALRSLSNLCIIREDGVEDCSDDFEENVSNAVVILDSSLNAMAAAVSHFLRQHCSPVGF